MNVLVVGSGGREHALVWKLAQSSRADRIFAAPGNAGTANVAENIPIASDDFAGLLNFAKTNKIGLVVIGPEAPLAAGLSDVFRAEGFKVFGPSKAAAQLEGSKVFCKNMLRQADVPTAEYRVFRDPASAERYIFDRYQGDDEDVPVVVKADGLASGKGAIVCRRRRDALAAIDLIGRQRAFGSAGDQIVIEERLDGQEASVLAITDGRTILALPAAQDHKPAFDGDKGPNTGGMGAYCPAPVVNDHMFSWIEEHVLVPTVHAMKRARCPFSGVLYAGLMMTNQGPKVLEYNVRFGDPECQPLLMRLKTDLIDLLEATADGCLHEIDSVEWDPRPSVCVVMASEGYPGPYKTGRRIRGLEDAAKLPDVEVFHAGTLLEDGHVVTNGGRVLGVTAIGDTISKAKSQAYAAIRCIRWDGAWCRKDISDKALERR
ncbi:phosphoribosylamine--glycine ligase [Lignipirellula cremea]|uniref:Phosphoribosylamine--glycine ligase n=1 Tax=Lignipirellula cremea TaxID=2528010 RepID=A0A518DYT3_9BACT|nr:phosphoribosylamine--glycine ligase [Lignipirellula cremea]QDU97002.1 Phosphoribosylamine--glycine ligase [Lignipirellula cremea]